MNEAILIWLYMGLGNLLQVGSVIVAAFLLVYMVALGIIGGVTGWGTETNSLYETEVANFKGLVRYFKPIVITSFVVFLLASFYPDKEDLKWIIGGALVWNGIEAASDIEGVDKLPENAVKAMNHFLETISEKEKAE